MNKTQPKIGVVIIGINVRSYLGDCIRSVQSADYPQGLLEIVYVDGGSRDDSPQIAKSFGSVKAIELKDRHPTPGRGRNAGWRSLSAPLIHFLDADTILHPSWFNQALPRLDDKTAAVCGLRREKYPLKNVYHTLTDMEWHYETGPCRYFGGDVLIKREVLEKTGGFDEQLVAGEDPELSYRVRQQGLQILRFDIPMTVHDINMSTLGQYLKRAYRSGYAYAEIAFRFIKNREKLWLKELIRITYKALVPILLVLAGFTLGKVWLGILLGLLILGRPFFRLGRLKQNFRQPWKYILLYAGHTALVVYPQFGGILRYFWGRVFKRPLKNRGIIIKRGIND
jgi:glycosyltransferase involved in cell wall biosynthesis